VKWRSGGASYLVSASTHTRILRSSGVLLILLGIVHLVATPHIASLIRHSTSVEAANMLVPPMLLNHVHVGVLLLPLGWLMLYTARHSAARVASAQVVVRTTAVTAATLPVILLALMGVHPCLSDRCQGAALKTMELNGNLSPNRTSTIRKIAIIHTASLSRHRR
jgi:hypothetical protein